MSLLEIFVPAFLVGLMGAGHCLGMCGGITAALSFALPDASRSKKAGIILFYNLGRISSYIMIGLIAGWIGLSVESPAGIPVLRFIAAAMLVLMGLYVAGWWKLLGGLEKLGAVVWRLIQPLGERFFPVKNIGAAFLVGGVWGWLPCGLVYSALVLALAQADLVGGAVTMAGFGLGTLPAVFAGGVAGEKLKTFFQKKYLRAMMGVSIILFGVWTFYTSASHLKHSDHSHAHHTEPTMKMPSESVTPNDIQGNIEEGFDEGAQTEAAQQHHHH